MRFERPLGSVREPRPSVLELGQNEVLGEATREGTEGLTRGDKNARRATGR